MPTYVDTSAFIALASSNDAKYDSAVKVWSRLVKQQEVVLTSLYAMVETVSLLHRRFGTQTAETFLVDIMPIVEVVWADVPMHNAAVIAMLAHPGKSGPSLVDCMSLEVIRQRRISDVFAYDRHFGGRGLNLLG